MNNYDLEDNDIWDNEEELIEPEYVYLELKFEYFGEQMELFAEVNVYKEYDEIDDVEKIKNIEVERLYDELGEDFPVTEDIKIYILEKLEE